jgi:hypothetical protein
MMNLNLLLNLTLHTYLVIFIIKNFIQMKNMNLPEKIKLNGYGEMIEFFLTDKREIKYYGKTKTSNESLWRTDKLKDNEVFYQTEWGWGVFVDVDKMETISYDGTDWGGQKIINS